MNPSQLDTLSAFFESAYLPRRLMGRSRATIEDMRSFLQRWAAFVGAVPLDRITEDLACRYLADLSSSRAAATANKHRSYLLAILRFARRRHLIAADWLDDLERLPEPRRIPRAYTIAEIERILSAANDLSGDVGSVPRRLWARAFILTLYDTGLRVGACLMLRTADLDLAERSILARAETQKQRADQLFRLSEQTIAALAAIWCPHRERLFPWPFARVTLTRRAKRLCRAAGVRCGGTSNVFHPLRKSTASYFQAAGGNATAQLGHSGAAVTAAYLDPRICGGRQAADVIPRPRTAEAQLLLF